MADCSSRPSPPAGCEPRSPRAWAVGPPGVATVFKLLQAAQEHGRDVNSAHLVALVRVGAKFEKGVSVGRSEKAATDVVT